MKYRTSVTYLNFDQLLSDLPNSNKSESSFAECLFHVDMGEVKMAE